MTSPLNQAAFRDALDAALGRAGTRRGYAEGGRTYTPFGGDYKSYGFGPEALFFDNAASPLPMTGTSTVNPGELSKNPISGSDPAVQSAAQSLSEYGYPTNEGGQAGPQGSAPSSVSPSTQASIGGLASDAATALGAIAGLAPGLGTAVSLGNAINSVMGPTPSTVGVTANGLSTGNVGVDAAANEAAAMGSIGIGPGSVAQGVSMGGIGIADAVAAANAGDSGVGSAADAAAAAADAAADAGDGDGGGWARGGYADGGDVADMFPGHAPEEYAVWKTLVNDGLLDQPMALAEGGKVETRTYQPFTGDYSTYGQGPEALFFTSGSSDAASGVGNNGANTLGDKSSGLGPGGLTPAPNLSAKLAMAPEYASWLSSIGYNTGMSQSAATPASSVTPEMSPNAGVSSLMSTLGNKQVPFVDNNQASPGDTSVTPSQDASLADIASADPFALKMRQLGFNRGGAVFCEGGKVYRRRGAL